MQNKIVESNKQLAVPTLKKIQNEPDTKALPHQAAPAHVMIGPASFLPSYPYFVFASL